jgi:hypothetical protein
MPKENMEMFEWIEKLYLDSSSQETSKNLGKMLNEREKSS